MTVVMFLIEHQRLDAAGENDSEDAKVYDAFSARNHRLYDLGRDG